MTELLFREDAYMRSCDAEITAIDEDGRIRLNRTVFYPTGGGQPGDNKIHRHLTAQKRLSGNEKSDIALCGEFGLRLHMPRLSGL